jgi:hypothetical protein
MGDNSRILDLTQIKVSTDAEVLKRAMADQLAGRVPIVPVDLLRLITEVWCTPEMLTEFKTEVEANPQGSLLNSLQIGFMLGVQFMALKMAEAVEIGATVMPQLLREDENEADSKKVN